MIDRRKKKFCAELAISSPPRLANFIKPRLTVTKSRKSYRLAKTDDFFPRTINLPISVIIPMYNAEKYIGECLDSLLAQTFTDFEVIVVDDCSTDNSVAVVESYMSRFDAQFTLKRLDNNSGTGGSVPRNVGFNLARGEYVYFVDADDYLSSFALEKFYTAAKKYEADVVYTSSYNLLYRMNESKVLKDNSAKTLFEEGIEDKPTLKIGDSNTTLRQLDIERNFNFPWTHFVRRDILVENQINFPEIPNGVDHLWSVQVYSYVKRFVRIPDALYFYRRYHPSSISTTKREPSEQVSYWVSTFVLWLKSLNELVSRIDVLKNNSACVLAAARRHFDWCLNRTGQARKEMSNPDIYEVLFKEFANEGDLLAVLMPFLFCVINEDKKINEEFSQTVNKLNVEVDKLKKLSMIPYPAISVIIPMYNAEKYIGECLDSLLAQTFQNFEVIVVDDCSTDNSVAVVESYLPKFNGHLILAKTETNSGGCAVPRNVGFPLAKGEYVFFMDSDDTFTKTGLEELFLLGKEYDADVVYCERYYMSEGMGDEYINNIRPAYRRIQSPPYVDKPTLEPEDLSLRFQKILSNRYWVTAWLKLVRRDLLEKNKIVFSEVKPSEDEAWTYGLIFFAKKFLRVPNMVYVRRMHEDSIMGATRTPQQSMCFWLNPVLFGLGSLYDLMQRQAFFKSNPSYCYSMLEYFLSGRLNWAFKEVGTLRSEKVYEAIKEEFGEKLGDYGILISTLCAELYDNSRQAKVLEKYKNLFIARIDVKFSSMEGDFQISDVSDERANVSKPEWLQDYGSGYVITSLNGELTFTAKAAVDGQIDLKFRSLDVRSPEDKSKRIPCWIDYTKLTVNGKTILNKLTPAWHGKPFIKRINAKADEEIKVSVKWQPHRSDFIEQKALPPKPDIPNEFKNYLTARVDINLMATEGDFQILSTSDSNTKINQPSFMKTEERIGYMLTSYAGKLGFVAKSTVDGQIKLKLRGKLVPSPEDDSKRIPYWIDYTALIVNDETIFDELTPAWYDKPYIYKMQAKADEEIKISVNWQPHMGDFIEQKVLPPPKPDIPNEFKNYLTARVDINLMATEGDFQILSTSDSNTEISQPSFMKTAERMGYMLTSYAGKLEFVAKSTVDGQIKLKLRGVEVRKSKGSSKRIPYWIDYTALIVNDETIFDKSTSAWYDKPYIYKMKAKANEEIRIKVEWLPHRSDT